MARYVGVLTMAAGEDKVVVFSPPADVDDPPDILDWSIEVRFEWTDGTTGFTKTTDDDEIDISTPDYQTTIDRADTIDGAGKRLRFQSRRVDEGFETELDYGYINVLA